MVEQRFRKPQVVGSIPTLGSKFRSAIAGNFNVRIQ